MHNCDCYNLSTSNPHYATALLCRCNMVKNKRNGDICFSSLWNFQTMALMRVRFTLMAILQLKYSMTKWCNLQIIQHEKIMGEDRLYVEKKKNNKHPNKKKIGWSPLKVYTNMLRSVASNRTLFYPFPRSTGAADTGNIWKLTCKFEAIAELPLEMVG